MVSLVSVTNEREKEIFLPRRDITSCLEWLCDVYQTPFQLWEWHGRWELLKTNSSISRMDHEIVIQHFIDHIPQHPRYQTLPVNQQESLVVIPMESTKKLLRVAVGVVKTAQTQSMRDVLKLLIQQKQQKRMILKQQSLLQQYQSQETFDVEELGWFGTLVENMSFNEADHSLTSHAKKALCGLKEMIQAESLTLVTSDANAAGQFGLYKQIFNLGKISLNSESVSQLLKLAGPNYFCESYINNFVMTGSPVVRQVIKSLVIIPALCNHRCFGWLIALNHSGNALCAEDDWQDAPQPARFTNKTALLMEVAASVLATHAHNLQLLSEQQGLLIGTVRSLINTIDTKDQYTCGHSDRVAQIAKLIAQKYGLCEQDCQKIYLAGLLHDIGKIGVRDEILQKPGQLTAQEFEEVKMHPVFGYEILKHLSQLQHVLPGVMHHHESWDGMGYPHKLEREEIPLAARILGVADAYDAMTSDRPYRKGMPAANAEQVLRDGAGKQWDPQVVQAFFQTIKEVHRVISNKLKRSYLPVQRSEYVFEEDPLDEDFVLSAILTTTSLSDITKQK